MNSSSAYSAAFPTLLSAAMSMPKKRLEERANKSAFAAEDDKTDLEVLALGLLKTARTRHRNADATLAHAGLDALRKVLDADAKRMVEDSPAAAEKEWNAFLRLEASVEELCPTIWDALDGMTTQQAEDRANSRTPIKTVAGDAANAKNRLLLTLARRCTAAAASSATPKPFREELTAPVRKLLASSPKKAAAEWEAYLARCSVLHPDYVVAATPSSSSVRRTLFAEPEPAEATICPTLWAALDTMAAGQLSNVANVKAVVVGEAEANADDDLSKEESFAIAKAKVLLTMAFRDVADPADCSCMYAGAKAALLKAKGGVVASEWLAYRKYAAKTYPEYLATSSAGKAAASSKGKGAPKQAAAASPKRQSTSVGSRMGFQVAGAACALAFAYCTMTSMQRGAGSEDTVYSP